MKTVKSMLLLFALSMAVYSTSLAQEEKPSPAAIAKGTVGGTDITINYSSPAVKGRTIWGGLEAYDKVWRTGANEATTIEFSKDVKINGTTVKAGKYSLFTIPRKDKWTVILNSVANQWGAYNYDKTKDILRFDVQPAETKMTERLKFEVSKKGEVSMAWEKVRIAFVVK